MDDFVEVQIVQCEGNVVCDFQLGVVGKGGFSLFQEVGEGIIHQLHQKDGTMFVGVPYHTQELNDVGMPHLLKNGTLLIKASREVGTRASSEERVQNFGSTRGVTYCGFIHSSIRAFPKDLRFVYGNVLVAKITRQSDGNISGFFSHVFHNTNL